MAATTTKHMDGSFEFPVELEKHLHDNLFADVRLDTRASFRPGVHRKTGVALDITNAQRTKKKIARAITALQDEYGVSEPQAREALAFANTWEDALTFLASQWTSEELPVKLRAKPSTKESDGSKDEAETGSLTVVAAAAAAPMAAESRLPEVEEEATKWLQVVEPVDSWDDDGDDDTAAVVAPVEAAAAEIAAKIEPTQPTSSDVPALHVEEAMSWTQKYLLQLEAEEEREKELKRQEAALSPEERELRDLEDQFTQMNERLQQKKDAGKMTKKKQKAVLQDIQLVRMQLVQRGWNEAVYRKKQQDAKQPAEQKKESTKASDTVQKKDQAAGEDDRLFYERDGRQSRLGFREDDNDNGDPASARVVVDDAQEEEEDYSGGLFDSSAPASTSEPAAPTAAAAATASVGGNAPVLANFTAASMGSWTGKTPRDLLQDYCQKHKFQRPQYKKLSKAYGSHLYSMVLDKKGSPRQEFEASEDLFPVSHGFRSINEAKDTVATVALYTLTPQLPLYGMMPPPYRALWLEWDREKQAKQTASGDATKNALETLIDEIFQTIPEEIAAKKPVVEEPVAAAQQKQTQQPAARHRRGEEEEDFVEKPVATLDSWDVGDWDDDEALDQGKPMEETAATKEEEEEEEETTVASSSEDEALLHPISTELFESFTRNTRSHQYQKLAVRRGELPIASFKQKFIEALETHNVILISGETGCGKSTQVPQYLLEEMVSTKRVGVRCQIVCTQPRRLAAISLAERVSQELGENAMAQGDSLCGFQIRLENRVTRNTRLLFCTTGILLRKLQDDQTLGNELSHIIVDEVHERDVQNDVLLSMLRTFLETKNQKRKHQLKVILMSATLNAASFQKYFGGAMKCPMLTVPGRTFPVEELYLEDALEKTQFVVDEESPSYRHPEDDPRSGSAAGSMQSTKITISGRGGTSHTQRVTWKDPSTGSGATSQRHGLSEYSDRTLLALDRLDESVINYELIEQLLEYLVLECDALQLGGQGQSSGSNNSYGSASILVFMPGLQEISNLLDILSGNRHFRDAHKFQLLPLHSSLSPEDQKRIFDMKKGVIRIIATTNIAETSLTIEDAKIVIDSGRAKEMRHNSTTKTNLLEEIWISKANAKQRLGRAGRTSGGLCYRLFSKQTFQYEMQAQPLPEIQRAPLTSLCLQIKTFGVEASCAEFLGGCLDAPDITSVNDALRELYEIGALEIDPEDPAKEQLTVLGSHLAQLPVDVKVGKLLLLGAIFGVFDAISTCAAILETKSPFVAPYGFQKEMQSKRQVFAIANSDLLTDTNAFNAWKTRFGGGGYTSHSMGRRSDEKGFCRQYFLSRRSLTEIVKLKKQFAGIVAQLGFLPDDRTSTSAQEPLTPASCALVAALLYGGMEPNVMYVDPAWSSSHRVALRGDDGSSGSLGSGASSSSKAFVHPGSINAKTTSYASPFLTYAVKLHTSQVYVPSCSMVLPSALCIFSFAMEIVFPHRATAGGDVTIKLNDWLCLKSSLRSAVLLQELRALSKRFIDAQIQAPPFRSTTNKSKNKNNSKPTEGVTTEKDADAVDMVRALASLFQQEYDARDAKQLLVKQLNPKLE